MTLRPTVVLVAAAALAACDGGDDTDTLVLDDTAAVEAPDTAADATATLETADGEPVGTVRIDSTAAGLRFAVDVRGLDAGEHGFHVHETGTCEAPDFTSAGGHLNPDDRQHGFDVEGGPHQGDFRNLEVGDDGASRQELTSDRLRLSGLLDDDGAAIVVHAAPDDYESQPAGDSGDRVACGVITRGGSL